MFAVQALNAHFVSGLILAVCIVAVILIDARCFIIPDWACLVIALTGAVTVTTFEPETLVERSIAAICAYAAFRGLNFVYRKWSGIDGLGHGDAKLIAAGCFWLRANSVAFAVLLASVSALMAVAISRSRSTRFGSKSRLPFGPHIALAIWIVWLSSIG